MKYVMKRLMTVMLIMAMIVGSIQVDKITVNAADSTVKIFIGESTTPRHHKAVALGEETEELSFALKGETVKSSSYSSSNPSSFKIKKTTEEKCIVETVSEGTGLVTLTVKTNEGNTYKEKLFISVYTRIGNYSGVANKNTDVYRGATDNAGVENEDDKGDIKTNTKIAVLASCDNYYVIKTLDGTIFEDDLDTGFVKKTDINVLAASLKINAGNTSVMLNNSINLTTNISPSITTNKSVNWNSSDTKISTIDSNGQLTGKQEGTVTVTAATKDGTNKKDSICVSVYSSLENIVGFLDADSKLYLVANNEIERGVGKKGDALTIVGQCKNYYRVKMQDTGKYTDYIDDEYCYIEKSQVIVPVESIKFNTSEVLLSTNQSIQLGAEISPVNATNKQIEFSSSNPLVAKVDSEGRVTTYKEGQAYIVVKTEDGEHTDVCEVHVSDNKNVAWVDSVVNNSSDVEKPKKEKAKPVKKKLKAKGKNDTSILLTWSKYKSVKKYKVQRAKGNSKKFKTIKTLSKKKKRFIDKKVKFYKKYRYRLLIIDKRGKKSYSNIVTARTKDSKVDIMLKAERYTQNSIKLSWNKQSNVKQYKILRKEKNGNNQTIATLSNKNTSYIDKNLKYYTEYYYTVEVDKVNKKNKNSNTAYCKTMYIVDKEKNLEFFRENYPFVCTDWTQNINEYSVYDDYYSPIKYQFDGETLKIHLYIEFAKYIGSKSAGYIKTEASRTDGKGSAPFVDLYKYGVKENFEVDIAESEYEFQGINFRTQVVFHEKGKENYNSKQYFNEILIGGECPHCIEGEDHWYHESEVSEKKAEDKTERYYARIYMPYDEQVQDNKRDRYQEPMNKKNYIYTCAHETGHALGLLDAYSWESYNPFTKKYEKYDRFIDNMETGVESEKIAGCYDNLMKQVHWDKKIVANDLEMMLYAYKEGKGQTVNAYQAYKTVDVLHFIKSPCIDNDDDLYIEDKR